MTNTTNSTFPVESGYLGFIIAPFSIFTIFINVFFFCIGVKILKKKAHNMFVISMCCGDCVYGISLFILAFVNKIGYAFSDLCFSQIVMIFISMTMTLTVALLICIDRYVTVKLNNFGTWKKSDKWKKKLAAISLTLSTGYVIFCILIVPRQKNDTGMCRFQYHYNPYYFRVIMALLSSLFVCLTLAIVVLYMNIVLMLFRHINQGRKVEPRSNSPITSVRYENTPVQNFSDNCIKSSVENQNVCFDSENDELRSKSPTPKTSCGSKSTASVSNIIIISETIETNSRSESDEKNKEKKKMAFLDTASSTCTFTLNKDTTNTVNIESTISPKDVLTSWKRWELRAFATSAYIIGSTLLLHGPLIGCLVADSFGWLIPNPIADIAALLVALQGVFDPFIYAFRFQELRQSIKQVICCGKKNEQKIVTIGVVTMIQKTEESKE